MKTKLHKPYYVYINVKLRIQY